MLTSPAAPLACEANTTVVIANPSTVSVCQPYQCRRTTRTSGSSKSAGSGSRVTNGGGMTRFDGGRVSGATALGVGAAGPAFGVGAFGVGAGASALGDGAAPASAAASGEPASLALAGAGSPASARFEPVRLPPTISAPLATFDANRREMPQPRATARA